MKGHIQIRYSNQLQNFSESIDQYSRPSLVDWQTGTVPVLSSPALYFTVHRHLLTGVIDQFNVAYRKPAVISIVVSSFLTTALNCWTAGPCLARFQPSTLMLPQSYQVNKR